MLLINLADVHTKAGRHVPALLAVEQALPIVRRHGDQRLEQAVLHNAALARIGLGRIDEARPDMDRSLELAQRGGATAEAALSLREFSQAMAKAGAVGEALELYHRERRLTDEANALNRQTALESLRTANDSERKDRDIELLGRDNALKAEALANHELTQRVAVLLTVAVALGLAVAGMLVWRLRETQRRLVASQAQLRVQSERDPLTQLANRRHFQAVMRQRPSGAGFGGALLMIDIDHFKQVNDRHGHAAGDAVLVEVARRLNDAVRGEDLVVRWGGEEFLVLARDVPVTQLEAMVQRVLQKVAQMPVSAGGSNATTADVDDGTVRRLPSGRAGAGHGLGGLCALPDAAAPAGRELGTGVAPDRPGAVPRQAPGPQPGRRRGRLACSRMPRRCGASRPTSMPRWRTGASGCTSAWGPRPTALPA